MLKKPRIRKKRSKFARFLYGAITLFLLAGIFSCGLFAFWASTLKIPDLYSFNERKIIQSTKIYDRTGKILLWDIHENIQRTIVPFDEISRNLKNATVAIEDSSFYQHHGVAPLSILRAIFVNLTTGSLKQGASTITQQLVKNTFLTREKSFSRKIKEIILTLKVEKALSKDDILNLYLNEISYGGNNYGVETASKNYFGKSASMLTLAESAYLAALPQAPTYYSPYGENREELGERKNLILDRMADLNFITKDEAELAKKEKVNFIGNSDNSIKAPHFTIYTRTYLEKKYGKDVVESNGLNVITTLDYNLQQAAEKLVAEYAKENKKNFNAGNAGLIAIDPKTGQILTMVGSKDYFNVKDEGNFNITLARRQPGSSIKPFIYATAFKKGYTPNTVVFDLPTEFNASCNQDGSPMPGVNPNECYMPGNYDNIYRGPISLRNALAQSINIPAVKTLYLSGINDSLATIQDMGITTLNDPSRYGLTLVLGGGEVSLLEMTGGYSVFANNGIKNPVSGILKIEDSEGNVLEKFSPKPKQALDKNISLTITDILSDNAARAPAFGEASWLYFPERPVAAKTGTTNNYRDAWVIGYTPNIAVGVWCGNNDNASMEKKVAGFIAAPLWNAFMKEAFKVLPKEDFEKPYPLPETKPILAGDWKNISQYYFFSNIPQIEPAPDPSQPAKPKVHSILYWVNKNDPLGPAPANPNDDPQFRLWEAPVLRWAASQGYND